MLSKNIRNDFLLPPFKVKFSTLRNEKKPNQTKQNKKKTNTNPQKLKQPKYDSYKKQNERDCVLLPLVMLSTSLIC